MKKSYISLIILSSLCIVFSCSRENEMPGGMQERSISFRASAASEAESTLTKTSYGSVVSPGNQTIEWTDKDRISLYSPHAVLYSPGGTPAVPATSYRLSVGESTTVAPVSPEFPLMWGLTNPHVFVAKYPDPTWETGANTPYAYEPFRSQSAASTDFLCYLPNTQPAILSSGTTSTYLPEMKYCYMAAYRAAAPNTPVNLTFTPCVSAFEIIIPNSYNNAVETFTVKKVELISATKRLSGAYTVHLTNLSYVENNPRTLTVPAPVTEADRSVAVDFGAGVAVTSSNSLHFTVFTCPVDLDDLTIRVTLASDDQQTLELRASNSGAWLEFDAFKKYLITCGTVPDPYEFDVTTDALEYTTTHTDPGTTYNAGTATIKVISTKSRLGIDSESPWKTQYSDDGGSSWHNWKSGAVNGFSLNKYSGSGNLSGEDITVSVTQGKSSSGDVFIDNSSAFNALLKSGSGAYVRRGSSTNYWNLSNPSTGERTSIAETANTYIVNAPGYYCFPLVMGNGVKNNAKNTVAYPSQCVNYKGTPLTTVGSPFLQDQGGTPTAAFVVWEEAKMVNVVDETKWYLPPTEGQASCITTSTLKIDSEDKTVYWLNFQITDDIKQGCIILAVTDGTDIMWSWNIWVTYYVPSNYSTYDDDSDLADVECTFDASGHKATFMPVNLGWVQGDLSIPGTIYESATLKVRFLSNVDGLTDAQIDASTTPALTLTRPELGVSGGGVATSTSHNAYYEWSRKDAFMSYEEVSGGLYRTFQYQQGKMSMAEAIKKPYMFVGTNNDTWTSPISEYWKLTNSLDTPYVKYIYDPCPAGYCIPRLIAFGAFRIAGGSTPNATSAGFNFGYYFYDTYQATSPGGTKTIFFPATVGRIYSKYMGSVALGGIGTYGSYQVSDRRDERSYYFMLGSSSVSDSYSGASAGQSVRPVRE